MHPQCTSLDAAMMILMAKLPTKLYTAVCVPAHDNSACRQWRPPCAVLEAHHWHVAPRSHGGALGNVGQGMLGPPWLRTPMLL